MKPFTEKELALLPSKLNNLVNQLTNRDKSPAKLEVIRARLDALHARVVMQLSELSPSAPAGPHHSEGR